MSAPKDNPFQTPSAVLKNAPGMADGEALYRLRAVGIATFFGTPLAGAWVMTQNLRHLGLHDRIQQVWYVGIAISIGLALLGLLPDGIPLAPFTIVAVLSMHEYAKQVTGDALEQHASRGGTFLSNWRAFGISLLFLLAAWGAIFVVTLIVAYLLGMNT
ncbi:hypothetical protein [Pseudomonas sp.]|uniref:hypothetical protein n=1 Tax=unclassified Pseudomonas TaxID=196821 RepID=UPI0031DF64C1